jgi:predicted lysophospholipase L1 biosynthesis ABC-type transport system permease subunit
VAIVDDRLAPETWPGQSAIGKRVRRWDGVWCAVVGVVGHIHANGVDVDPRPQIYWSHHQVTYDRMVLVVRGNTGSSSLTEAVTDAVHGLDAEQPLYDVRSMDAVVGRSLVQRRLTTALIAAFGAIALVLAAVGLYGVVSYGVTQRGREFGVRLALGASPGDVTRFVVRDGLSMAVVGSAIGLVAAFALGGVMSTLIFGVTSHDVISLVGATAVLFGVAALASYLPARRAAAIDPAVTLRAE